MAGAVRAVRDLVARGHAERGLRERGEHHDVTFCKVTHDPELCLTVEVYVSRSSATAPRHYVPSSAPAERALAGGKRP